MSEDLPAPLSPAIAALSPRRRVVAAVQAWIDQGLWQDQDWLPAEETLAEQLAVSRSTVRAGLQDLVERGILIEEKNRGRRVSSLPGGSALLGDTVAFVSNYAGGPVHHGLIEAIGLGASEAISEAGLHMLLLHPKRLAETGLERLINGHPRGVLLPHDVVERRHGHPLVAQLQRHGVPVVACTERATGIRCDRVAFDHVAGCRLLIEHLYGLGKRRVLRLWSNQQVGQAWGEGRDEGYRQACQALGIEVLPAIYMRQVTDDMDEQVREAVGQLVDLLMPEPRIDAILVSSDFAVAAVSLACRKLGQELPVAGYDDLWEEVEATRPTGILPVATIDKQNRMAGEEMVHLLLARASGALPVEHQVRHIAPKLILPVQVSG